MAKVTIDKETFKALASDTRLEILKALDGRKMNLSEIARKTGLSKTTILEHMNRLVEANLVKKIEREGHKWTYYKLTWRGSSILHPDNTKIVITLCVSIFTMIAGVSQLIIYGEGFYLDLQKEILVSSIENGYMKSNETINEANTSVDQIVNSSRNVSPNVYNIAPLLEKELRDISKNHTLFRTKANSAFIINMSIIPFDQLNASISYENITTNQGEMETGTNISHPEEERAILNLRIFYQDPFYLYCGSALIITSVILSIAIFRRLWNRKPAF